MKVLNSPTRVLRVYLSGPIAVAAQVLRHECLREGLCVTLEPTTYFYTGGEERGFVVGFVNYPRFPSAPADLDARALRVAEALLEATAQHSALVVSPERTFWMTRRLD